MARPSDARDRMIRAAAALFRQKGYDGVGLTEILAASDAPKGSFYHHFPAGKEQLAEAAVAFAGESVARAIDRAMTEAPTVAAGIDRLAAGLADWFEKSGFREGCPIASVALDAVPQSERLTIAVRAVFDAWERRLVDHARRLGDRAFDRADAEHLLMLMEGAWILARVQKSREPLLRAAAGFVAGLAGGGAR